MIIKNYILFLFYIKIEFLIFMKDKYHLKNKEKNVGKK